MARTPSAFDTTVTMVSVEVTMLYNARDLSFNPDRGTLENPFHLTGGQ